MSTSSTHAVDVDRQLAHGHSVYYFSSTSYTKGGAVRLFMFISFFYLCEMPRRNDHALSKNKEKIVKVVWGGDIQICMKERIFQDDSCHVYSQYTYVLSYQN